jgi:DnaJ-class molecular chaperone
MEVKVVAGRHYKRIRRLISVPCGNCLGTGIAPAENKQNQCPHCKGTGEVQKWLIEIVNDETQMA